MQVPHEINTAKMGHVLHEWMGELFTCKEVAPIGTDPAGLFFPTVVPPAPQHPSSHVGRAGCWLQWQQFRLLSLWDAAREL